MVIIVLLVLLFIVAIYRAVLQVVPGFYNYLCLLGVIGVGALILAGIILVFVRPTHSQ